MRAVGTCAEQSGIALASRGEVAQICAEGGGQELGPLRRLALELPQDRVPEEGRAVPCDVTRYRSAMNAGCAYTRRRCASRCHAPATAMPKRLQARVRWPGLAHRFSCPGIAAGPEVYKASNSGRDPPPVAQPLDWRTPRGSQA